MNRKPVMLGVVLTILTFVCGCTTPMRNLSASGPKLPVRLAVKLEATEKTQTAMDEKVRPAVLNGLALGFLSVTEIQTAPPYSQESLSDSGIDGVAILNIKKAGSRIPILLQIEGYHVTYECDLSIYGPQGNLLGTTPLHGNASFRSPVISGFNDKGKLSKLGDKAANNLSAEVIERLYNAFK